MCLSFVNLYSSNYIYFGGGGGGGTPMTGVLPVRPGGGGGGMPIIIPPIGKPPIPTPMC